MRIGFEAKRLFLNNRGLGNYARNLLYGLEKYYPSNDYFLYTPQISNEYVSHSLLNSENINLRTPQGFSKRISGYWRSYMLGINSQKDHLNIFHGLSQELPKDIKRNGALSIVTIHDMIYLKHPEFYKPIDRWIYEKKVKFAVNNADKIIAISIQTKDDLLERYKLSEEQIIVIYQSCNEVFYKKRSDIELKQVIDKWSLPNQFILYVGALNENKNVMLILEALKSQKGDLDIPLVVVGHGSVYKKKMQEFVDRNDMASQLIFASETADPSPLELSSFYQLSSAFIFPSFYEGFGIPILEARFSRTPVLASNSSCLQEAGGKDSSYFDPTNALELASLLSISLANKDNVKKDMDKKFTLEGGTEQLMRLYTSL